MFVLELLPYIDISYCVCLYDTHIIIIIIIITIIIIIIQVCFAKYGCYPVKEKYHHEVALRALLHAIDTSANRYKKHIEPWISVSPDFYVRVFMRVFVSPVEVLLTTAIYITSVCVCICIYMYVYI